MPGIELSYLIPYVITNQWSKWHCRAPANDLVELDAGLACCHSHFMRYQSQWSELAVWRSSISIHSTHLSCWSRVNYCFLVMRTRANYSRSHKAIIKREKIIIDRFGKTKFWFIDGKYFMPNDTFFYVSKHKKKRSHSFCNNSPILLWMESISMVWDRSHRRCCAMCIDLSLFFHHHK